MAYGADPAANFPTKTPIKHLVVIFQENVSFDHYFGTYPVAANTDGTSFTAAPGTPTSINTLLTPLDPSNGFMLTGKIFSSATRTTLLRIHPDPPLAWRNTPERRRRLSIRSGFRTRKR